MSAVHLHLVVNHVPIIATWLALPVLLFAFVRVPARDAWTAATMLMAIAALSAAVTLWTGEPAEEAIEGLPGVDPEVVDAHEERGETGAVVGIAAGVVSVGAWLLGRRSERAARAAIGVTLVTAALSAGVLSWVGYSGGLIRHPEIHDGGNART